MKIINETSDIDQVPLANLRPHPRNPNQGDVGAIHLSIAENGWYGAIVAQRSTGYILAGNHRYLAAMQSKAGNVPVIWVDVDDQAALRILLADNRTAELADKDDLQLSELLKELAETEGGLLGTGYDGDDLDELLKELEGSASGGGEGETDDPSMLECPECGRFFAFIKKKKDDGQANKTHP